LNSFPLRSYRQFNISAADSGRIIPSNDANLLPGFNSHVETFEHGWKTRSVTEGNVLQFYTAMSWPPRRGLVIWQFMRCFLFNLRRIINDPFHRVHVVFSFCGLSDEPSESDIDESELENMRSTWIGKNRPLLDTENVRQDKACLSGRYRESCSHCKHCDNKCQDTAKEIQTNPKPPLLKAIQVSLFLKLGVRRLKEPTWFVTVNQYALKGGG
jgi:hypothetical protein